MKKAVAGGVIVLITGLASWWLVAAARVPALPALAGQPLPVVEHLTAAYEHARAHPTDAEALGSLGMAYHADLFPDRAVEAYRLAERFDPSDWRWPYYMSLIAADRGHARDAADRLRRVVALQPDLALAWWRLGDAEFKDGRYDAAVAAYDRARVVKATPSPARGGGPSRRETLPVSVYASLHRARVALVRGELPAAAELLETLVAAYPRFGPARRLLGDADEQLGRSDEAERQRRLAARSRTAAAPADPMVDALAEESRSSTFLLKEAGVTDLRADGVWREHLVRRALETNADSPEVVYELATLLHQRGRHDEALVLFQRYRDLVPDDDQVLTQIGRCLGDVGRWAEAERSLRRALESSDEAVTFYDLGFVLEGQGRRVEAAAAYRRALALDPGHASAHTNLAAMLAHDGHAAEALTHFAEAARVAPDDPDVHNNLGGVLAQMGQLNRARAEWLAAIDLEPSHADAHANLGVLLQREGRTAEARKEFEAALRANPQQAVARKALRASR